jgi:predicted ATPase
MCGRVFSLIAAARALYSRAGGSSNPILVVGSWDAGSGCKPRETGHHRDWRRCRRDFFQCCSSILAIFVYYFSVSLREIHVSGYRSVRELKLKLRQINVLTGPNASGKSNLYNSVFLLAKAAVGGFAQVIAEEGGMPSVLWAGARKARSLSTSRMEPVRMSLGVRTETFNYELVCGLPKMTGPIPPGQFRSAFAMDPEVKEEHVWMDSPGGLKVTFFKRGPKGAWILDSDERLTDYSGELQPTESVLSQLREPHLYPELSALRTEMSRWRFYHHFRTDADSPLRRPQVGVRTPVLSHDGRDLAAALQTINEIGMSEDLHFAGD